MKTPNHTDHAQKVTIENAELEPEKKIYESPELTEYGTLTDLTQSGGSGAVDATSGFPT